MSHAVRHSEIDAAYRGGSERFRKLLPGGCVFSPLPRGRLEIEAASEQLPHVAHVQRAYRDDVCDASAACLTAAPVARNERQRAAPRGCTYGTRHGRVLDTPLDRRSGCFAATPSRRRATHLLHGARVALPHHLPGHSPPLRPAGVLWSTWGALVSGASGGVDRKVARLGHGGRARGKVR